MNKESRNQIFTRSYVIKRLVEHKFYVTKLVDSYPKDDTRYWTIIVNPGRASIIVTCIRPTGTNNVQFRIYSKDDASILVETKSLSVLVDTLINLSKKATHGTNQ